MLPALLAAFAALACIAFALSAYTQHVGPLFRFQHSNYAAVGNTFGLVLGLATLVSFFVPPYYPMLYGLVAVFTACVFGRYFMPASLAGFTRQMANIFGLVIAAVLFSKAYTADHAVEVYLMGAIVLMSIYLVADNALRPKTLTYA